MLSIHILNVGHGNSAIIQYQTSKEKSFGVIDSNHEGDGDPPVLSKLIELGADNISFIALTHPHADHYTGLSKVIETYKNKISNFYSYPIVRHMTTGHLKELAKMYGAIHQSQESKTNRKNLKELVTILKLVKDYVGVSNWTELTGFDNRLAPDGFAGVEIKSLLPPAKVKGRYFQMLESGKYEITGKPEENEFSVAFLIKYKGIEIILGGDGTHSNWIDHRRDCSKSSFSLNGSVVQLPHHGSKKDCSPIIIDHLFKERGKKIACISANGLTHPDDDTLKTLKDKKILPYCTNYATHCGTKIRQVFFEHELSETLLRYINILAKQGTKETMRPCQGNITISINDAGELNINTQYKTTCLYRGDLDFIFSS